MEEEITQEIREFIRSQLSWLADFLHKEFHIPIEKIRPLLHEMADVTV